MQFELPFSPWRARSVATREDWLRLGARQVRLWLVPNRRARRYVLRLRPDGAARVTIPRGGSAAEARRFAERNAAWLEKQVLAAVERHLWRLAARELPGRVLELAALHQAPVRRVTVRNQRSRWGSCSRAGTVSLNWRLVQAPVTVRDYIILHELAHLKEMNHSRRFWREVARLCPDFATAGKWLKQHSELLR